MIQALIGPIAELAGGWLKGKADANAAAANLKLVEAEAKATIMKNAATSESDWERVMAEGSQNSWKDEWLTILFFFCRSSGQSRLFRMGLRHWSPCLIGINTPWV
jgi:hypothetical protein